MPYSLARAERVELSAHDPMPLFLSDPEGEPDPGEFTPPSARTRGLATQLVAGVLVAAAIAVLVTLFHSDVSQLFVANAKALMGGLAADQSAPPPQVARQTPQKDPARVSGPTQLASADAAPATPSREAIASAYQSALQAQTPAPAPVAAPAPAPVPVVATPAPAAPAAPAKTLDADTLAGLMTRAKSLMAVGDIAAARLLLERAANAQDANAAFMLAQTYDPAVLGTNDTRSITADPAAARNWYQKAAQLGSADARQRLAQLQN
jgi:TPR repeat protein